MKRSVLITGGSGGVGTAVKKIFFDNGYHVISVDKLIDDAFCHEMIQFDIENLAQEPNQNVIKKLRSRINPALRDFPLTAFIHNAGLQIVKPLLEISIDDIDKSLRVNMISALVLGQMLYPDLSRNQGSIVNIGSIHATQSKANFGAYSISKTALSGLTKAMSLEWGSDVPVNSIDPAAIDTPMLREGLNYDQALLDRLSNYHPTKSIASTVEVARLIYFLVDSRISFINGSSISIDGGISKRLHDPN